MQDTSPKKAVLTCRLGWSAHYDWPAATSKDPGPLVPESAGGQGKIDWTGSVRGSVDCRRMAVLRWCAECILVPVCKYFSSRFFCFRKRSVVFRDSTCFVLLYILLLGMDAASAVVALVGFVATTIEQLNRIITTLGNAQMNVSGLVGYLEQLRSSLTGADSLIRRLGGKGDQHQSLKRIDDAVKYCNGTLNRLETLVKKVKGSDPSSSNKVKKTMTSVKYYLRKDDILEAQNEVHKAMTNLNGAILADNWHR